MEQTQWEHPVENECEELQQQVSDLTNQLGWDGAHAVCQDNMIIQYEQELDEARLNFDRQKTLKEMFINKGKATRKELERLEKYSNPDTLSTARIATMVGNRIRRTKKKELQQDYEELQVAFIKTQEKYEAILQEEKRKIEVLQDELARIRSHQVDFMDETEVLPPRQQQADAFQHELESERMQRAILQNKNEELFKELQVERLKSSHLQEEFDKFKDSQHKIRESYEAEVLQKKYKELQEAYVHSLKEFTDEMQKNKCLQEELEKMTVSKLEMERKYEADVNTARQEAKAFQQAFEKERQAYKATIAEGLTIINTMKAEQEGCYQQTNILKQNAVETQQEHPVENEHEELQQQVSDLTDQLGWDGAHAVCQDNMRIQYEQQVDEARQNFDRQKTLKEMFINKGKATRKELERLEKYSDPETLSTARIATMVGNRIRRTKKKELQRDYEELQVAFIKTQEKSEAILQNEKRKNEVLQDELENERMQRAILQNKNEELFKELQVERLKNSHLQEECDKFKDSQHKIEQAEVLQKAYEELQEAHVHSLKQFTDEMQAQDKKNKCLQEELEKMTISKLEMEQKYEADVNTATQEAKAIQQEFEKERQAHKATVAEDWRIINAMKAEQDGCCQQINILKQNVVERENQLEEVKAELNSQILINRDLSDELEADRPPRKRARREERNYEPCEQEQFPSTVAAIEHSKGAQITQDKSSKQEEPIQAELTVPPLQQAEAPAGELPETAKPPSLWKRTRHFLGLRKPESWKKKRDKAEE